VVCLTVDLPGRQPASIARAMAAALASSSARLAAVGAARADPSLALRRVSDAVAGGLEARVAEAIALERLARAVVLGAVDLDDEPLGAPEHVDLVPAYARVDVARRQARRPQEREHAPLGLGTRHGGLGGAPPEVPERRRATVTVGPRQHALEVAAGDESADLRPLGAAGQLARRRCGGDVEERAGDAGHLDAMAHGPVTRIDLARAMGAHPGAPPGIAPDDRDIDGDARAIVRRHAPQRGS
jgi:hypothetical protein